MASRKLRSLSSRADVEIVSHSREKNDFQLHYGVIASGSEMRAGSIRHCE